MYNLKSLSYKFEYVSINDIKCNFNFDYKGLINPADANCKFTQKFIHMIAIDCPRDIEYRILEKAKEKLRSNMYIVESLNDLKDIFEFCHSFYFDYSIEYYHSIIDDNYMLR